MTVGEAIPRTGSEVKYNPPLALQTREILYNILNSSDWDTFKQLKLVSKEMYQTSMQMLNGFSPLMQKAFFKIDINELFRIIPIEVKEIYKKLGHIDFERLGITDIEKTQANFAITINNDADLKAFAKLIKSDNISSRQNPILSKIQKIDFPDVTDKNIDDINTILNYFSSEERASQLTNLSFHHIGSGLTLPRLPNLTKLYIETLDAKLTLPNLQKLNNLSIKNLIYANLMLPELSNLTDLSFGRIVNGIQNLPILPNLTNLSIALLCTAFPMPHQPYLKTVSCTVISNRIKSTLPEQLKNNARLLEELLEAQKERNAPTSIKDSKEIPSDSKTVSDTTIKDELTLQEQQKSDVPTSIKDSKEVAPSNNAYKLNNLFKIMGFSLLLLVFISQIIKNIS